MRSPSLTRRSRTVNGRIVSDYTWRGNVIGVHDSARNALLVIELFGDEQLVPEQKEPLLVRMLFEDPAGAVAMAGPELGDLLASIVWDAFGLDITADHEHASEYEPPVFDWDEDAARIRASLLQCYGINWDEASSSMTYLDLCSLLGSLLESESETPFQQAIYYRTAKPPKPTKYNREMREAFDARVRHYALGQNRDKIEAQNAAMDDMFAAMKRAAKGA